MGDAPDAQDMTRDPTKVVPQGTERQFLFTVDVSRPLGMTIDTSDSKLYQCMITEIVEGGQANAAGVEAGMIIIGVNYKSVEGTPHDIVIDAVQSAIRYQESLVMEVYQEQESVDTTDTWCLSKTRIEEIYGEDLSEHEIKLVQRYGGNEGLPQGHMNYSYLTGLRSSRNGVASSLMYLPRLRQILILSMLCIHHNRQLQLR